jgi:hypothetical protein
VNTFVFSRLVSTTPAPITHLYTYDFSTKSEQLLSKLDEDKGQGGSTNGLTISPDRQWIAFGALRFRLTPEEASRRQGSIWAISADGSQFRKLTSNLTPADKTGACSRNPDCLWGQRCRSGQCTYDGLSITPNSPTWAPDGKRLFFRWVAVWSCIGLPVTSCYLSTVDGTLEAVDSGAPCQLRGPAIARPGGETLLVPQIECNGDVKDGLYEWSTQPLMSKRLLFANDTAAGSPVVQNVRPAWLPNGSGGVFIVGVAPGRNGVMRWLAQSGETKLIYSPADPNTSAQSITVGPQGQIVVELSRKDGMLTKRDLYLLDPETGASMPLTQSGDSQTPAW